MNELIQTFINRHDEILMLTWQHIYITAGSVALGALLAIPLGIWLADREKVARYVLGFIGTIQTIPSLAFFGFAFPILGIGLLPAMTILFLYSIFPILRNTYTGIKEVNPALVEAGRGMGMNKWELLTLVKLPLALPLIIGGVKISTVYIVSWATVAALIGAGGLGDLILGGISMVNINLIIAGTIPASLLAILFGLMITQIEKAVTPQGLRAK
ncbi:ABC transporter permease [Desulforamulus aquiferis]|uniref:ABC transporter permease n=1 Tax=Desulforamulus aquiferis TaxID=1397668 RepID=A0AAW7ZD30_9FIRM|nr:ABC transporter permease [Desulforamulus aquiferis]MDO7787353.1 ABC transporter permease [Desulforamulus aquiferis]RYD03623.1 choline ABC transporter permease [Desulforamulus aquiferis]